MSQDLSLSVSNSKELETEEKPQKSLNEKQQVSIQRIYSERHALLGGIPYQTNRNFGCSLLSSDIACCVGVCGSGEPRLAD